MRTSFLLFVILGALARLGADEPQPSAGKIDPGLVRQAISAFYKEHGALPRDGSGPWLELIGKAGGPEELRKLCSQAAADGFDPDALVRAVDALAEAASIRAVRPAPASEAADPLLDPDYQMLTRLLRVADTKLQAAAARLAGAWKMEYAADRLSELAASPDAAVRLAAFEALRPIGGKTALTFFAVLARPDQRPETRRRALVAIAEISLDGAVMKAVEVLPLIDNEADALETWRGLLKVERAANAFAVRLPKNLPPPVVAAGLRAAQELGEAGEPLVKVLTPLVETNRDK